MTPNPITVQDIELSAFDGEPRALDTDIALRLGYTKLTNIRNLIERNADELSTFGPLLHGEAKSSGGRPGVPYYLNEAQALLVAVKSETENAQAVRAMLIRVFMAWRRGELPVAANSNQSREGRLFFKHALGIAKMGGLRGNAALIAANRVTRKIVGIDHLDVMGMKYLEAPDNDVLLNATDLGAPNNISAIRVNHLLAENGYQVGEKDAKGRNYWLPTEKGVEAGGQMVEVERSNKTGQARQLRWPSSMIEVVRGLAAAA